MTVDDEVGMAIKFRCPCGKKYSVDDTLAGRTARCKVCGRQMMIPAFVAAAPPPPPFKVNLQPGRRKRRSDPTAAILIGEVAVAVIASILLDDYRDLGQRRFANPNEDVFPVRIVLASSYLLLGILYPLTLPPILSRRRVLSIGRWLLMAVVAIVIGLLGLVMFATAIALVGAGNDHPMIFGVGGLFCSTVGLFGLIGCLVAAAIHPKS